MTTIVSRGVKIVADRNGKSSKLLGEFEAKTVKDNIPLRNQVQGKQSRGAVSEIGDAGLTRVAEFPQRVADTREREINEQSEYIISSLHFYLKEMPVYETSLSVPRAREYCPNPNEHMDLFPDPTLGPCGVSGILYDFEVYTGKTTKAQANPELLMGDNDVFH
ncbi:hypothetical protein ACROYT_G014477 [Oculina patagonica]